MFLKKNSVIVCLLIIAAVAAFYFYSKLPPEGVGSKGDSWDTDTIIALIASIVSTGGSIVGLFMKYQDIKEKSLANRMKELDILEREKELAKK